MKSLRQRKIKLPKVTQLLPLWQKTLVIVYKSDSLPVQDAGWPSPPGFMVLFWAGVQGIFVQQRVNTVPRNKQPSRNPHRSAATPSMSVTCHHLWVPDCYPPFLEVTAGHSLQQQENKQHQSYHLPCFSELDALLDIMCEGVLPKGTREGRERCRQRRGQWKH